MSQTLYRFYDKQGTLIYVGITLDPPARFRSHTHTQNWWDQVSEIRIGLQPDRPSVLVAEKDAIRREGPRYNITHNTAPASAAPGDIRWACDGCGREIAPGQGYIYVNDRDIETYERALRERETQRVGKGCITVTLADLADGPHVARWHVYHGSCDPEPEESGYWIDVGHWATASAGFDWAAHLVAKSWIQATDFEKLLRRAAGQLVSGGKGGGRS